MEEIVELGNLGVLIVQCSEHSLQVLTSSCSRNELDFEIRLRISSSIEK